MAKLTKRNVLKRSESRARYFIREKAKKRGWNVSHPSSGGSFLEENEIISYFPDIGLGSERPDFIICHAGLPVAVIEAKNESGKIDTALKEACEYADTITATGRYVVNVAIGAAGEEDTGFDVVVFFRNKQSQWLPLQFKKAPLTAIPSPKEIELALIANDGTTSVSIPEQNEFIDAAIELSSVLRLAKVEAPLRPKVIGALVTAMNEGDVDVNADKSLTSVNLLLKKAISAATDLGAKKQKQLIDALELSGADFNRLSPNIGKILTILKRLNIKAVLKTDTDFLGMFYEAFLRYGYDNNSLGIVFTPRHITRYCVQLTGIEPTHTAIDVASGTGGFLVAAFDEMNRLSESEAQRERIRESLAGFDTNPTIWALASLNMFFRGDGKSHIENGSCLDEKNKLSVVNKFDRAYLNPPFSQDGEPEYLFINAAMAALKPGGVLAAVVMSSVFSDAEHQTWRKSFLTQHRLLAVISLPEDLFYPTSAPTSIVIAKSKVPQANSDVFVAKIWNDGYEKLKGRRVPCSGEQLSVILSQFKSFLKDSKQEITNELSTIVPSLSLSDGQEWSPEQWITQPDMLFNEQDYQKEIVSSIFQTVVTYPDIAESVIDSFTESWNVKPDLPLNKSAPLSYFFEIVNGKSSGEKNYADGECPYISSGDKLNSVVRLVSADENEVFKDGGITITAFGQASVQPWPFVARGNGGSSVRVLQPRFKMSVRDLIWFSAQINMQKWRFHYLRMAIKGRISGDHFLIKSPSSYAEEDFDIASKIISIRDELNKQSCFN